MAIILLLMFGGLLFGFTVIPRQKDQRLIKLFGKAQAAATAALLFVIGAWLGGNGEFWANLGEIGIAGVSFALATMAGSAALVWLLVRLTSRKEKSS